MPDIEKINNVAVADISKIDSITFAHGQKVNNQDVSLATDAHTLISSQDAGGATSVTFSSLGSYDVLLFDWINFDSTDGADDVLSFQVTTSSYSYNAPITSTYFRGYHNEANSTANHAYYVSGDQANADQVYQWLGSYMDEGEDDSASSGNLTIFGHSSGTYVKHFMSRSSTEAGAAAYDAHVAGNVNTIEAVTAVQFKAFGGGTFTGTFDLYGLATS
jgi:hypothetical protein